MAHDHRPSRAYNKNEPFPHLLTWLAQESIIFKTINRSKLVRMDFNLVRNDFFFQSKPCDG